MNVIAKIQNSQNEMSNWRHQMHQNPELAFEEFWTSDFIAKCLDEMNIPYDKGIATTGIVATLKGVQSGSGKSIALRADFDALEIHECTNLPYASKIEGKMHGCGHDGHTAMLLGAAKYLVEHRDFDGTVYFVFQPAEEGAGGARVMLEQGFKEKYPCDAIFGMHNWPGMPIGMAGVKSGAVSAAADRFKFCVTGKGGHAAMPHLNVDVVTALSELVMAVQTIVSRKIDPADPAVISITQVQAGTGSFNVMPEDATLGGTVRTFSAQVRQLIEEKLLQMAEGLGKVHDVKITLEYNHGYPSVVNSIKETELAAQAAKVILGEDQVVDFPSIMGAEDFAYFLEKIPGCYILLGQGTEDKSAALHSPHYDFNDDAAPVGASYWVELVKMALPLK